MHKRSKERAYRVKRVMRTMEPKLRMESLRVPSTVLPITKQLIERCWLQHPSERPSFEEIFEALKGHSYAIMPAVDPGAPQAYVDWIEEPEEELVLQTPATTDAQERRPETMRMCEHVASVELRAMTLTAPPLRILVVGVAVGKTTWIVGGCCDMLQSTMTVSLCIDFQT
jgi:hypothetical protein